MECRPTVSKGSCNGTSIYDGVFSGSAPFRPSGFSSSRPDDYVEIFGGSRDPRPSSIPVLDVPDLHNRKVSLDVRSSKLEYANIFGGGSGEDALSHEEVGFDTRKMRTLSRKEPTQAYTRSPSEVSFSGSEDSQVLRKVSRPSLDNGKKQFNVSYSKSLGGSKDGINGTTHIAQLHDVPGYARLVDENKGNKPLSNDGYADNGASDRVVKAKNAKKSKSSLSSSSPEKKYEKTVLQNRSRSNSSLFEGYEFGLGTEPSEVQASSGFSPNFSSSDGHSRCEKVSECGASMGSPTYFDNEVDANSVAAASADAVRKAIEKAQARIKIAKELMERRKEAFQGTVESKVLREQRREHKRASKLRETASLEQNLKGEGNVNSKQVGREITGIADQVRQSDSVASCTASQESTENQAYNRQGKTVEGHETKLSGTIAETGETEIKTLENKQGTGVKKIMQLTNDCEKLMMGTAEFTTESTAGISRPLLVVEAVPLQEVYEKSEDKLSAVEEEQKCDNSSDKFESIRLMHYVEKDEMELEIKGEERDHADEFTAHRDQAECCVNPERFTESLLEANLDAIRFEEKAARAEDSDREGNEEKVSQTHEVEGEDRSSIVAGSDEKSGCKKIDGKEENAEREGEPCERECGGEGNDEKQSEGHEVEDGARSKDVLDGEEENTAYVKIYGKEEIREIQAESCEKECDNTSEEAIQETKKEYDGFGFGADARHWLDHMKEILNVRINSFLDAKENSKPKESSEVEGNHQLEVEGSENILEETRCMEASKELEGANEFILNEKIIIDSNVSRECEVQNAANEGKADEFEELTESMEVPRDVENKDGEAIPGNDDEDEENEVMAEITDLSAEEKDVPVIDSANLNEDTDLSVEGEDASSNNLEEMCGSETSDLPGSSLEADGEKQEQDAMEVLGFSEKDVKLGLGGIKFGFLQSHQYIEEPEEICDTGKHVEGPVPPMDEFCGDEKGAEISSNEEEEAEDTISQGELQTKVSIDDRVADDELNVKVNQLDVVFERKEGTAEINQETPTSQATDKEEESRPTTKLTEEKEPEDRLETEVEMDRDTLRKRDDKKERERERDMETEREREKERLAVERAIREARERAFAEARERAERAAVEKATAEARQRVMAHREKLEKASSENLNRASEKASVDARRRAERAAVERATAEARERALEKAMSEKLSGKDNKLRQKSSDETQHKSSGPSSNNRNSHSSDNGVPRSTERSNGANDESVQRSKARLERHQRTAERAAKALAEKNMRDLLAQREQAEKNRLAEALDADIKRWSSGKQGNLRALLSTLQYVLGPDSGWQPVTLTEIVAAAAVKKAYRKATLCVHPDKLQQRGASLQQKYICEKVFDLLKEAWNRFSAEEK